jgi:hypothetical protein
MSPELLHLYNELYKTGAYFDRNPRNPGLYLNVIDKWQVYQINEFEVPEVRSQLLPYLFGTENLQHSLSQAELLLRELPVIQSLGKKPFSPLPEV